MPVEIPAIQSPFKEEPIGKDFVLCLQQLYGLSSVLFPLTMLETANFTGFSDPRSGARAILNWHKIGLLNLGECDLLDRPAIAVVKLTQVYLAKQPGSFGEVFQLLTHNLPGSGLEIFIGQCMPKNFSLSGRIQLLSPDDPFYIDELGLKAHTNGYRNKPQI